MQAPVAALLTGDGLTESGQRSADCFTRDR
jgi:hypothetical protein